MNQMYIDGMVSVIIPVYNAEKYLQETLNSIYEQLYDNIEIVLVDDCSNDSSSDIIYSNMQEHEEIVYFRFEKNVGAGKTRNKALELAKGQYVAFLDSDDIWLPQKIERQIVHMREKGTPFCYTAIEMIDSNGNLIRGKRDVNEICDYNYLQKNTVIATSSVVVDRKVIGEFYMSERRGGQDYATWMRLLRKGIVAHGINEVFVKYRVSSNSLSSNKLKSIKQIWEIQIKDEGINPIKVLFNEMCFCFNAMKKYLLK